MSRSRGGQRFGGPSCGHRMSLWPVRARIVSTFETETEIVEWGTDVIVGFLERGTMRYRPFHLLDEVMEDLIRQGHELLTVDGRPAWKPAEVRDAVQTLRTRGWSIERVSPWTWRVIRAGLEFRAEDMSGPELISAAKVAEEVANESR